MKQLDPFVQTEIAAMVAKARTGDWLAVRTNTFYGVCIRNLLSRGLKRCWTNHNAPVYVHEGVKMTMQFEPPSAHEVTLAGYLVDLYKAGGRAVLMRCDSYVEGLPAGLGPVLVQHWRDMDGTPYDKESIWMFVRMLFRKRAHVRDNDKARIYCTEGTFDPLTGNLIKPWKPDALTNEARPAPIHAEQTIRAGRARFVAGNKLLYDWIVRA
jgi:hypothetical protein